MKKSARTGARLKSRRRTPFALVCAMVVLAELAGGAAIERERISIRKLDELPPGLVGFQRSALAERREGLEGARSDLLLEAKRIGQRFSGKSAPDGSKILREFGEAVADFQSRRADPFNREADRFNADVAAAAAGATSGDPSWTGPWTANETNLVWRSVEGWQDKELRDWTFHGAAKVRTEGIPDSTALAGSGRTRPATNNMISANGTNLTFKNGFFVEGVDETARANLVAFEAGKVAWATIGARGAGADASLEKWFQSFRARHPGLTHEIHSAAYGGQDLSGLGDQDTPSEFGYAFSARALGLGGKRWEGALQEFHGHVFPLLRGSQ